MKKVFLIISVLALLTGISVSACHCVKNKETDLISTAKTKDIEVLPTMNSDSTAPNRIWVGTFQIVWNDVIDNLIKHPIEFVSGTTQTAKNLNLSDGQLYKMAGNAVTVNVVEVIAKKLMEVINDNRT